MEKYNMIKIPTKCMLVKFQNAWSILIINKLKIPKLIKRMKSSKKKEIKMYNNKTKELISIFKLNYC